MHAYISTEITVFKILGLGLQVGVTQFHLLIMVPHFHDAVCTRDSWQYIGIANNRNPSIARASLILSRGRVTRRARGAGAPSSRHARCGEWLVLRALPASKVYNNKKNTIMAVHESIRIN